MSTWRRAERLRLRPWTDPRLLLGALLVLGATVLGARLVALGDDSVEYWAVASDARAGSAVGADDLVATRVRLDGDSADRYLRVEDQLPAELAELQWGRDVGAGELLDADSLARRGAADVRQLPLTVTEGAVPTDLAVGDDVEIWVGPGPGDDAGTTSQRVLAEARVLSSGADAGSLGGALARTVLVEVPAASLTGDVVSVVGTGRVTVVRVG